MKTISSICAGRMLLILTALSFGSIASTSSALAGAGELHHKFPVDGIVMTEFCPPSTPPSTASCHAGVLDAAKAIVTLTMGKTPRHSPVRYGPTAETATRTRWRIRTVAVLSRESGHRSEIPFLGNHLALVILTEP